MREALCGAGSAARGAAPADAAARLCFAPLTLALSSGAPRLLALRHTLESVAAERAAAALLGGSTDAPTRGASIESAAHLDVDAADAEGAKGDAAAAAAERRRRKREKQKGRKTEATHRADEERAASDAAGRREAEGREAAAAAAAAALGAVGD